jgi:hypothetical protein
MKNPWKAGSMNAARWEKKIQRKLAQPNAVLAINRKDSFV